MSLAQLFKTSRLKNRARSLTRLSGGSDDPATVLDIVTRERKFTLIQKRSEFLAFLEMVKELRPRVICDIGSSGGATIRLFSQFAAEDARIFSIDIENTPPRQAAFPFLVRPGQSIKVFQGSSYAPETLAAFNAWRGEAPIDLLFIDGDHTYDGVAKDFQLYAPLVRPGGLVAFHDIVEDYKTRYGRPSPSDVGEVPRFWREIKTKFTDVKELIKDPQQDGFGIGVIRWTKN